MARSATSATSWRAATGARASPCGSRTRTRTRSRRCTCTCCRCGGRRPWPESEVASREALERWLQEEGGYVHIQGTRPQTLAYGLQDSPVGLMSWIAEKFDRWTDARGVPTTTC